jgi:hypothetical protein
MVIERYEEERPDDAVAPRLGDTRVLEGDQWAGPPSAEAHEAELRAILGGPNLRVML